MSTQSAGNSPSSKKWDQVLTRVRGMLDETLANTDRQLAELGKQGGGGRPLERQLEGLEKHLQTATALVEQTDLDLANTEKAVRAYLSDGDAIRQRLANWAGRTGP